MLNQKKIFSLFLTAMLTIISFSNTSVAAECSGIQVDDCTFIPKKYHKKYGIYCQGFFQFNQDTKKAYQCDEPKSDDFDCSINNVNETCSMPE